MLKDQAPVLGQIYVQVSFAAMSLLTSLAFTDGLSPSIFVTLRQVAAAITITPCALSCGRSPVNLKQLGQIFILAILGVTLSQNLYYLGLAYTSTTLASTMNNLLPAATFVIAVLLGMESVDLKSMRGLAKVLGTLVCIVGGILMIFVKGPDATDQLFLSQAPASRWILGSLLSAAGVCSYASCFVYQAVISKDGGPSQLTLSAIMCWMGAFQSAVVSLLLEDLSAWRLEWNLQLFVIAYSGIFCSGFGLFVQLWAVRKRGPVFVAIFNPFSAVLVAILEPWLLHVPLYWGSIVGMAMVIGGLYSVVWGKALDMKETMQQDIMHNESQDEEAVAGTSEPLLK